MTGAIKDDSSMALMDALFGPTVWRTNQKDKKIVSVPTQQAFKGKEFLLVYYGAKWSSLCTDFTPKLVDFYKQVNKDIEILYVSSDDNAQEFQSHFEMMPWTAMESTTPELAKRRNDTIDLFKAFLIPCLGVLHVPTGRFVTEHGVKDIIESTTTTTEPKDILKKWRDMPKQTFADAQKTINHGGGVEGMIMKLLNNPLVIVAAVVIMMVTSVVKHLMEKPLILVGVFLILKRWSKPSGDQNLPGKAFTLLDATTTTTTTTKGSKKSN